MPNPFPLRSMASAQGNPLWMPYSDVSESCDRTAGSTDSTSDYSRKLMTFLRGYTDQMIEQVSVDECYMDFTEIAAAFFITDGRRFRD